MADFRDLGIQAEPPESYPLSRYQRLSELVVQQIIDWIVNGTLTAGQRLTAEDVASKLGVSRSPVREALRVLEAAGYLESAPYRGTWVKQLTAQEIEEVYMLREMLEGQAAYFAAQRISPGEIDRLERINRAIAECVEAEDRIRQQELNKEFHFTLYSASRKPRLCQLIKSLWDSIAYYRLLYSKSRSKGHQTQQEHQSFIEACRAGDATELQRLVAGTIRHHAQEMIDLVAGASRDSGQLRKQELE